MCCGSTSTTSSYDPQVGEAALKNAATAEESLAFTKDYYNNVLTPQVRSEVDISQKTEKRAEEQWQINKDLQTLSANQYKTYGLQAQKDYYDMVHDYSSKEEEERQAQQAFGDVTSQAQTQRQNLQRQFAAQGIDPTSPAAISAASDASVMNAAAGASAANRARTAARSLGIQLKSDANNVGTGLASNVSTFGQLASNANSSAMALATAPSSTMLNAGNFMQSGYKNTMQAYQSNANTYASMANSERQAKATMSAAESSALGSGLGSLMGAGLGLSSVLK